MKIKEAKEITGGLGFTQKTGMAYGLPAVVSCQVGAKLACVKGSVCEGCYGVSGRYQIPTVLACQKRRMASVEALEYSHKDFDQWVDAMVLLISRENEKKSLGAENKGYFRWHDTGDLISLKHLQAIVKIARKLPKIKFWLPTKEIDTVISYTNVFGQMPKNLCVRLSSYMVDKKAKTFKGLPTANVHTKKALGQACPAIEAHSGCGKLGCRKCWDKTVKAVSYKKH